MTASARWQRMWGATTPKSIQHIGLDHGLRLLPRAVPGTSDWEMAWSIGSKTAPKYVVATASVDATTLSYRGDRPRGSDRLVAQFPHHSAGYGDRGEIGELGQRFLDMFCHGVSLQLVAEELEAAIEALP